VRQIYGGDESKILRMYSVSRVNFMVKLLSACVGMPWRWKAMKDVASCDKLRGDASNLRSGDF
jgi:hypothetical protein